MKKILTVSLFAMLAVSAANADIASTAYVEGQTGTLTNLKTTAKGNLVAAINEVDDNIGSVSFTATGATKGKTNLTEAIAAVDAQVQGMSNDLTENITKNINELGKDVEILNGDAQTAGSVLKSINDHAVNSVTSGTTEGTIKVDGTEVAVAGLGSAAYTESSAYAAVAQGSENANKAVITDASGNIKTGTITSGMITDKTIVNADISDTAEIAQSKISGLTDALSGKQATIADLTTIRSGAAAGATALQKADIATGTSNGTISVEGANVAVAGLGSAAYTESSTYATSAQGTKADNALARTDIGVGANFTIPAECKAEKAVCSLVVREGVAGWEKVSY